MQNVYSGLVRAGTDLLPQPDLALRWEYRDPQTVEFTLRQGARFHNGREVLGDDVKYSLERILDPAVAAPYASYIESVESIEAPDKYRVVLHLKRPDAALVNNLAMPSMAIVPREVVEANGGSLKTTMVGSDAFGPVLSGCVDPVSSRLFEFIFRNAACSQSVATDLLWSRPTGCAALLY